MTTIITENCTGCMACYNKCPKGAITISYSKAGFYTPHIDTDKCVDCGLCYSVCPQNKEIQNRHETTICYAVMAKDEVRKNSASGGVFAAIAKEYINNGGYVCGAAFSDDFKHVNHIIINKLNDLIRLQNSKYVQSNIGNTFIQIKQLLEDGKRVLFSGTPCQVAGLNNYLGLKYDNLLTIDIVCHGIPSPLVWEKYLAEISKDQKIKSVSFRNKSYGWHNSYFLEIQTDKKFFKDKSDKNLYYRTFFDHLLINESCYSCKYTNLTREGDLTLGDFWGIENYDTKLDDNKGTSLVLVNTDKGRNILDNCKSKFLAVKDLPIQHAIKHNPRLHSSSDKNYCSKEFINNLQDENIVKNIKQNLCPKYEGIIRNFWFINNFGATLSAYAIQQYFLERGFDYRLLKTIEPDKYTKDFMNKYLKTTHLVNTYQKFLELNLCSNNFVLGTDQVLRDEFVAADFFNALFTYTKFNKKRIVFSGSFGIDNINNITIPEKILYSKFLRRFDYISTRESSGVDICKNEFGLQVERIIDPVFLVDKQVWDKITPNTQDKYKDKIISYIFKTAKNTDSVNKIENYLSHKFDCEVVKIVNGEIPVEEFLSAVVNARYIVTNSFHGLCFALIFKKKVLGIKDRILAPTRFNSLISLFNINHLFVDSYDEIFTKDDLFSDYDNNYIDKIIVNEKIKAEKWFNNSIRKKKNITLKNIFAELGFKLWINLDKIIARIKPIMRKRLLLSKSYAQNKKIVFWGASLFLEDFLNKNKLNNPNIIGIIDSNPNKTGLFIDKYEIFSPKDLEKLSPDEIIVTIINSSRIRELEIKEYLKENYTRDVKISSIM